MYNLDVGIQNTKLDSRLRGNDKRQNNFMKLIIPKEVSYVTETLQKGGFEAYLVGGCVRDVLMGREPKDWDVTTNATPEEIQKIFPKTFCISSGLLS